MTETKGLKANTLGLVSSMVIGLASTAPAYSLASSLGLVADKVQTGSPAVMLVAFVPMFLVAISYYYLNRVDADCGTTFSWCAKAFGPVTGWTGGWVILITDVVVMTNLAVISGRYTLLLFEQDSLAHSTAWVTVIGVGWIVLLTWSCYVGIEFSAKVQWVLCGMEILILAAFTIVATSKAYGPHPTATLRPSLSWLNPLAVSSVDAFTSGLLIAVFIYWGWDALVSVNEETRDAHRIPGVAALLSTVVLLVLYVAVSVAAQAVRGTGFLVANSDDVLVALGRTAFAPPWDKLLIVVVLTSASASTLTTIMPTARTMLSMASKGAIPSYFARIHPRYQTPSTSTIWMGIVSVLWYLSLTAVSEDILSDSIAALGLLISFYYGLSGFACTWFFRRKFDSAKSILLAGVLPCLGGLSLGCIFVKSVIRLADPANSSSGASWFGMGPPLVITAGLFVLGLVLMLLQRAVSPTFFQSKPETAPREMKL